jgi:hypothetical protein
VETAGSWQSEDSSCGSATLWIFARKTNLIPYQLQRGADAHKGRNARETVESLDTHKKHEISIKAYDRPRFLSSSRRRLSSESSRYPPQNEIDQVKLLLSEPQFHGRLSSLFGIGAI